jgi:hypothetical protein
MGPVVGTNRVVVFVCPGAIVGFARVCDHGVNRGPGCFRHLISEHVLIHRRDVEFAPVARGVSLKVAGHVRHVSCSRFVGKVQVP